MGSKVLGYVRISKATQKGDRQVDLLEKEYRIPKEDIFVDAVSGTKFERPALDALQKVLREGDTVVVESLSRVSRSSADLLLLLDDWQNRGITFISDKERLDFSTTTGKLILAVLAALSQFERDTLRDRVLEGLQAVRERGRIGGKPRTAKELLKKAVKLYEADLHSISEIVAVTGVSKSVIYRELRRLRDLETVDVYKAIKTEVNSSVGIIDPSSNTL